jgi:hypothetical protein
MTPAPARREPTMGADLALAAKVRKQRRRIGYGYVGAWQDGTLGWCLPLHLDTSSRDKPPRWLRKSPNKCAPHPDWSNIGEPSYLCEITIKLILDKRGRPIVRRIKERQP